MGTIAMASGDVAQQERGGLLIEENDKTTSWEFRLSTIKGRACLVQWISSPVFAAASSYVYSHANTAAPCLGSAITLQQVAWLVGFICAVEAIGQTPLGLA